MIDTHIHILPALDDGSPDIDVSIAMAKEALKKGFDKIIATPHFIKDSNELEADNIIKNVDNFNNILKENNINVEVYQGSEIYFTPDIVDLLDNNKVLTYSDSKYFLMELPIIGKPINYIDVLKDAIKSGYIPVIAHPERYEWLDKNYNQFRVLKNMGVKFQINFGSILEFYGNMPKKNAIRLLKDDMVDLIGTDSHGRGRVYSTIEKSISKIISIIGKEKFEQLTKINPQRIINDKEI